MYESRNTQSYWLWLTAAVVFSVAASWPLFSGHIIAGDDASYHAIRIVGHYEGLISGDFPVRMNPAQWNGYGSIEASMYPNLFIYIPAAFMLAGANVAVAWNLFHVLINITTAVFSFWSFEKLSGSARAAAAGSMIYGVYLYRLVNVYGRAALGETLAMTFFPAALVSVWLVMRGETKYWSAAALAFTGVLQSHIITSILMLIAAFVVIVLNAKSLLLKNVRIAALKSAAITFMLNIWFYCPFLYFYTTVDFPMKNVLHKSLQNWTFLNISGVDFFAGSFFLLLLFAVALFVLRGQFLGADAPLRFWILLTVGVLAIPVIDYRFPWDSLNFLHLNFMEFPWKLEIFAAVFLSFAMGSGLSALCSHRNILLAFLIILISFFNFREMITGEMASPVSDRMAEFGKILDHRDKFTESELNDIVMTLEDRSWASYDIYYIYADAKESLKLDDFKNVPKILPADFISSDADIKSWEKRGTNIRLVYSAKSDSIVRLPLFYYQGYEAVTDSGRKLTVGDMGDGTHMLAVRLPAGENVSVSLSYAGLPISRVTDLISLIGLLILIRELAKLRNENDANRRF